jgi:hypothetical protein
MPELIFMKLGMFIMTPKLTLQTPPISIPIPMIGSGWIETLPLERTQMQK